MVGQLAGGLGRGSREVGAEETTGGGLAGGRRSGGQTKLVNLNPIGSDKDGELVERQDKIQDQERTALLKSGREAMLRFKISEAQP
jgi:hypothetical protein